MLIAVLKLQMVNPAVFSGEIFDKISTELVELNLIENSYFSSKVSDGCECVQRRCHLHEFPSAKVFSPLSIQFKHGFVFLGTFLWSPYLFLMWVKLNDASKVPSECRGKNMAGQSTWVLNSCYSQISVQSQCWSKLFRWVFGAVLIFVAVMIAAVTIFLRRRRMNSQRERRQEEDGGGGEEGERASDPLKKDSEGDRPLLEEQTSSEQPSSRKMWQ